jgi:Flp pilus assembly protein TadD
MAKKGEDNRGHLVREWAAFATGLLGAVLGSAALLQSCETARVAAAREGEEELAAAWDLMGGAEGSESIVKGPHPSALQKAEQHLRRAAIVAPDEADVHRLLGIMYQLRGRTELAEQELRTAVALEPKDGSARNALGQFLAESERFADAERELRAALQLDPHLTVARVNLSAVLTAQHRPEEGLLEEAVQRDPSSGLARLALARSLLRQRNAAAARIHAEAACRLETRPAMAFNVLAATYWQEGQLLKAVEGFKEAVRLDPTFERARLNLRDAQAELDAQSPARGRMDH